MRLRLAMPFVAAALVCGGFFAGRAFSEDPTPDMAEMMKLMAPGPQHEVLKVFEGSWEGKGEWNDMGMSSKYTEDVVGKMAFGGRFLQLDSKMTTEASEMMPSMTMNGHGFIGYDNGKQTYAQVMLGDWSTAIGNSEGAYDAASKTFTMEGTEVMGPGKSRKFRTVAKVLSPDSWTLEFWFSQPDGTMQKAGSGTYTRKK